MSFQLAAAGATAGLLLGIIIFYALGRRAGLLRRSRHPNSAAHGTGPVEASLFGLLGLLLAFTFSGAAERFETRRHLITAETNAIGTAYLRLDLLPADARAPLRELFRHYVDVRLDTYLHPEDPLATQARLADGAALQSRIWAAATAGCARAEAAPQAGMLLLPALNEMFDITTTRLVATENHPPRVIFALLAGLILICALLVGDVLADPADHATFKMLLFAATMTLTFYVIVDLEYPRLGLIRIDAGDQLLVALRASWH